MRLTPSLWTKRGTSAAVIFGLISAGVGILKTDVYAEDVAPLTVFAKMPVKEVTVFKDGYAFVLQSGNMPTAANGSVLMDKLPAPVLGTFWPYSDDANATLTSVVAGNRPVSVPQTAMSMHDLILANVGARVHVTEISGDAYDATISEVPTLTSEEAERASLASPSSYDPVLPRHADIALLKTTAGTKVVSFDAIRNITFLDKFNPTDTEVQNRSLLTLNLDWHGHAPAPTAKVGMIYLQEGLRWIPSYKVEIDGMGNAQVSLEGSVVNNLADLDDATVNLVVGVPHFAYKDMTDPIAIQQTMADVGRVVKDRDAFAGAFTNALMSQTDSAYRAQPSSSASNPNADTSVTGAEKNQDLFVYTVKHVTLKNGQRMVLPIATFAAKYQDIYTLDIPFAPPPEAQQYAGSFYQTDQARRIASPLVIHTIRIVNKSPYPYTTAPALILSNGRPLGQSEAKYAAVGACEDLDITTAGDISVKRSDKESGRVPNAEKWDDYNYNRTAMTGDLKLINYSDKPIQLEATRTVFGQVDTVDHEGTAEMIDPLDAGTDLINSTYGSSYWNSLPNWWSHFNGFGRYTWKLTLPAKGTLNLAYTWHYLWR